MNFNVSKCTHGASPVLIKAPGPCCCGGPCWPCWPSDIVVKLSVGVVAGLASRTCVLLILRPMICNPIYYTQYAKAECGVCVNVPELCTENLARAATSTAINNAAWPTRMRIFKCTSDEASSRVTSYRQPWGSSSPCIHGPKCRYARMQKIKQLLQGAPQHPKGCSAPV